MAGVHGLPVKFRGPGRGFPWAWDEEVAAAAGRQPGHQSVRLGVVCLVASDAIAEAVIHQDVRQTVALDRGLEEEKDEEVAEAQDAARPGQRELQVQQPDVPPQVQPEPALRPGQALAVLLREPPALERPLEMEPRAQVSPPQAQEHEEPLLVQRVSPQPEDARGLREEQQVQPLAALAAVQPLLPQLLSQRVRLPRRFRHPRHPGDVS
ncbi:MAG TPA: hypothetical protein VFI45_08945 [Candidatus Acidoferrum sp.]|nr:hypothetical protein [Candidatus Acidoferrum sp.]